MESKDPKDPVVVVAIDPGCHSLGLAVTQGGTILDWRVVDLVPSVKKPTIARVVQGAVTMVATVAAATGAAGAPDVVRIEQQPNQNVAMKVLSHVLQGLFLATFPEATVTIVSAKAYKLAGGTYASRKRDSVVRVGARVAHDPVWGPVFAAHKKKDDLADALLLAHWEP